MELRLSCTKPYGKLDIIIALCWFTNSTAYLHHIQIISTVKYSVYTHFLGNICKHTFWVFCNRWPGLCVGTLDLQCSNKDCCIIFIYAMLLWQEFMFLSNCNLIAKLYDTITIINGNNSFMPGDACNCELNHYRFIYWLGINSNVTFSSQIMKNGGLKSQNSTAGWKSESKLTWLRVLRWQICHQLNEQCPSFQRSPTDISIRTR